MKSGIKFLLTGLVLVISIAAFGQEKVKTDAKPGKKVVVVEKGHKVRFKPASQKPVQKKHKQQVDRSLKGKAVRQTKQN